MNGGIQLARTRQDPHNQATLLRARLRVELLQTCRRLVTPKKSVHTARFSPHCGGKENEMNGVEGEGNRE